MTIDDAIKQIEKIAEEKQKVVDTHRISDEMAIEEIYCDDTEIIEERLAVHQKIADDFRQLAEWLKDYKRLKEQTQETEVAQFARWVAKEIFSDMWEFNKDAFDEIACRKLAKLGIVRANGNMWELVVSQESEE